MLEKDSSKKAKTNLVRVAGEDLYRVDEELSPLAEEVMGERNLITMEMEQQARGGRKDQD